MLNLMESCQMKCTCTWYFYTNKVTPSQLLSENLAYQDQHGVLCVLKNLRKLKKWRKRQALKTIVSTADEQYLKTMSLRNKKNQ